MIRLAKRKLGSEIGGMVLMLRQVLFLPFVVFSACEPVQVYVSPEDQANKRQGSSLTAPQIFQAKCVSCHGTTSSGMGGFNYVDNVQLMVERNKIRPGVKAEISPLFARILSDASPMPPSGSLSDEEKNTIKIWIESLPKKPFEYQIAQSAICNEPANQVYGSRRIWLLTPQQIQNSLVDILGFNSNIVGKFSQPLEVMGFSNNAEQHKYSSSFGNSIIDTAEDAAAFAVNNKGSLLNSCRGDTANRSCVETFVNGTATLFFRRSITDDERSNLMKVYDDGTAAKNSDFGFEGVVQAMIISPSFLYRTEVGANPTATGVQKLTNFEIASLISFTLTNSPPDNGSLFKAALDPNLFSDRDKIRNFARDLLNNNRNLAKRGVRAFYGDLLSLRSLDGVTKDTNLFSTFNKYLKNDMKEETLRFVEEAVLGVGNGTLSSLLSGNFTFLNKRLATHYGVSGGNSNTSFIKVSGSAAHPTAGLLTQGSVMSIFSTGTEASPIKRGKFIREKILCYNLPDPPPGVPQLPAVNPSTSLRERYTAHSSVPQCIGCHSLIDPIGFGFLNYNPVGQFRNTEDADGEVIDAGDAETNIFDGVTGTNGLGTKLGQSRMAGACLTTNFFIYAMGRPNEVGDRCEIAKINSKFFGNNLSLQEMMLSTVSADGFVYRK